MPFSRLRFALRPLVPTSIGYPEPKIRSRRLGIARRSRHLAAGELFEYSRRRSTHIHPRARHQPMARWGHAVDPLEFSRKMGAIIESRLKGDFHDRTVGVLDQPICKAHAHPAVDCGRSHS